MSGCISRRQVLLAAAGAALGLCGCAAARQEEAASGPELILRYAENQPEDYPTTQAALAFADLVNERTGGRVKVAVYSGGELGAEQSVIQQMQFGGIDFARISLSQLAEYVPALSVLQLPYLYEDAAQMWRVLIGTIGDEFLAMLDAVDLVGLSWFDAGVRSFYTREKVTRLADLQGLTLRVQESDMMSDMVEAMGAVSVQVVYSDVYAALHNRKIDGAENNWPSYEAMSHYEVAPYFLQDEHTRVPENPDLQPGRAGKTGRAGCLLPGHRAGMRAGKRPAGAPPLGPAGSPGRSRPAGLGRGSDPALRRRETEVPGRRPAAVRPVQRTGRDDPAHPAGMKYPFLNPSLWLNLLMTWIFVCLFSTGIIFTFFRKTGHFLKPLVKVKKFC